jgi:hypothetical protein
VQVQTSTLTPTGTTLLPPAFGRAVVGAGYAGKNVQACAQASWASAGATTTLSVSVSLCSWKQATNSGAVFAAPGPYPPWPAGYPTGATPPAPGVAGGEQALQLHGDTTGAGCTGNSAGWQLPGGFGWLDDPTNSCSVYIDSTLQYPDRSGVPVKADCITALDNARTNHTTLFFPVYDGVNGSGGNGTYHLAGLAAFVVTGGYLNGSSGWKKSSLITGTDYCKGSQRCLYGFFTGALLPPGTVLGGTNFGVSVVTLIG